MMDDVTAAIARLREALRHGTQGPLHISARPKDESWCIMSEPGTNPSADDPAGMEWIASFYDGDFRAPGPNARGYVLARNALPALLAVVEAAASLPCPVCYARTVPIPQAPDYRCHRCNGTGKHPALAEALAAFAAAVGEEKTDGNV